MLTIHPKLLRQPFWQELRTQLEGKWEPLQIAINLPPGGKVYPAPAGFDPPERCTGFVATLNRDRRVLVLNIVGEPDADQIVGVVRNAYARCCRAGASV